MGLLAQWLDTDPEVPAGRWLKRFSGMIVCGNGEMVTTFLRLGQLPAGQEIRKRIFVRVLAQHKFFHNHACHARPDCGTIPPVVRPP